MDPMSDHGLVLTYETEGGGVGVVGLHNNAPSSPSAYCVTFWRASGEFDSLQILAAHPFELET